ncbi:hypothetical protein [Streptomyces sp. NPDC049040]|uniref:hypothetical protein n=1 Tax=Streptomyces sp. NPDC049040 TaxID=3365593 RepID=UPI0037119530
MTLRPIPLHAAPSEAAADASGAPRARRWDLAAGGAALLFFLAMAAIGGYLQRDSYLLRSPFPPLEAWWMPHAGPGTPFAVAVAVLVVAHGPTLARRLSWRALPVSAWAAAMAWTWALALIDGWQRGVAGRLTASGEYLVGVRRFDHLGPALRGFTGHILLHSPDNWPTHIAGHPAGAILTFVGLDRIGLGGGAAAGIFCITTGASLVPAVLLTLRIVADEERARAAAPFVVLAPGAVWVGVSADGYFAAVAAWALALLAVAATRTSAWRTAAAGLGSGLLFGAAVYLSYGLVLLVIPAAAILLCTRSPRPLPYLVLGAVAVGAAFTAAGFDWWEAYGLLRTRYHQGYGGIRPYSYWFFGDLATVVASAGVASVAGLRRVLAAAPAVLRKGWRHDPRAVAAVLLPCGFLAAVLAADLSGLSKAETERIWLPFALWLTAAAAFLPRRDHRAWLAAQALAALLVNHLLLTVW